MHDASPPAATPDRKNVRLWKSHNHRRWDLERQVLTPYERAPFVCECTGADCVEAVELTVREFETAHMHPWWSAVRPGHLLADDGSRVVLRRPRFWAVELSPLAASEEPARRSGLASERLGTL
jgi:hypothetical protein